MGYSLWCVKIYPPQNQDLRILLERPYKELLNALISFKICHSVLKLWQSKKHLKTGQSQRNSLQIYHKVHFLFSPFALR